MAVSDPVSLSTTLAQFMALVQNHPALTPSVWHEFNPPADGAPSSNFVSQRRILGPQANALPAWPANVGPITTSNVFHILHLFAIKLTRHRQAQLIRYTTVPGGYVETNLGFNLTSYKVNHTITFDIPATPVQGTPMTSADLDNFLNNLRAAIISIRNDINQATVFASACHSSCHASCHGSRGRR